MYDTSNGAFLIMKIIEDLKRLRDKNFKPEMYFKTAAGEYASHDKFLGIRTPALRKALKQYALNIDDLDDLISSEYNEIRAFALHTLVKLYKLQPKETYEYYIKNIKHVNNWNLVDISAHFIVGPYLQDDREKLMFLAKSEKMWERRIAIVATWHYIRMNDHSTTLEIAKALLNDKEDLMHKATGWMLREVGKKDISKLRLFLDKHHKKMPRTMLRYAIERMDDVERSKYMN